MQNAAATSMSPYGCRFKPQERATGSNPTHSDQGDRGGEGKAVAVSAASGPRRSKRVALIKGRTSNNPLASQTPRASNPARAAVLEHLHTNAASLDSASSRWNGCGCRDVLWWSPVLAHREPTAGRWSALHCSESACGATTAAPHPQSPDDPSTAAGSSKLGMGEVSIATRPVAAVTHTRAAEGLRPQPHRGSSSSAYPW